MAIPFSSLNMKQFALKRRVLSINILNFMASCHESIERLTELMAYAKCFV